MTSKQSLKNKKEAAMEIWGQSIPVRGKRKCSSPSVETVVSTGGTGRRRAGWRRHVVLGGEVSTAGSAGPRQLWGRVQIFFKEPKCHTALKLSVWRKYTLRNNSFCCSLSKSNCHQEHGLDLRTAAAGNNHLFSIWSESHAEFYEFSDVLQHFLATIKYCLQTDE